jgi:hypothetical protein
MDANKKRKLTDLGYRVLDTCGRCMHGQFKGYEWGTCQKHTYQHQKHSYKVRQLSIHRSGYCNSEHFQPKPGEDLHGFKV